MFFVYLLCRLCCAAGTWHDFPKAVSSPVVVITMNSEEVVDALAAAGSARPMGTPVHTVLRLHTICAHLTHTRLFMTFSAVVSAPRSVLVLDFESLAVCALEFLSVHS